MYTLFITRKLFWTYQ